MADAIKNEIHIAGHRIRADDGFDAFLNTTHIVEQKVVEQFHKTCWWLAAHGIGFFHPQFFGGPVDTSFDSRTTVAGGAEYREAVVQATVIAPLFLKAEPLGITMSNGWIHGLVGPKH